MRPVGADLATSRVTWSVGGALIVDGVDCTVPAGSVTGLLGPNGSGKSTLLRLVAGVQSPDGGTVTLGATDLGATKRRERARLLAFVEQEATTDVALTVLDAVLLGRIPHRPLLAGDSETDRRIVHAVLERLDLTSFSERDLATLSGGERQRVHVARALAQEPSVLLLDEPTNHLDIAAQLSTMTMLGKLAADGVTVFAALHDLNLAAGWCDHVILLSHGKVAAAGAVADVLVPGVVDDVYGVRSEILRHPTTGRPVLTFTGR